MIFKVGDKVEYKDSIDSKHLYYIVEDVRQDGWIWSSKLSTPHYKDGGILKKNFYNPIRFRIALIQIRKEKLEQLGI